jgi:hypothetical protein
VVGKSEEKRPLGRRRCRWDDNNKMDHEIQDVRVWARLNWLRVNIF